MAEQYVTLAIAHIGKSYPEGAYAAQWYKGGSVYKSKTLSLSCNEPQIAYETVDLWAEDNAKAEDMPYKKVSQAELAGRIAKRSNYGSGVNAEKEPAKGNSRKQAVIYKNPLWFNACLDEAIKAEGIDRVVDLLQKGLTIANKWKANEKQMIKKNAEAKHLTAVSLLNVFKKTGISVINTVDDEEIKAIYTSLLDKEDKEFNLE